MEENVRKTDQFWCPVTKVEIFPLSRVSKGGTVGCSSPYMMSIDRMFSDLDFDAEGQILVLTSLALNL